MMTTQSNLFLMTYDSFTPLQVIKKVGATFNASRFEVWMGGKMIDSGSCVTLINFLPTQKMTGEETLLVTIEQKQKRVDINEKFTLDASFSQGDRLTHATIPPQTTNDCIGLATMRSVIGITDARNHTSNNTPYCGNQFFKCKLTVKVTFSLSDPEKLVEFYSEKDEFNALTLVAARCSLELLIDDYDSDGAYVSFEAIKNLAREAFGVDILDKHLKNAESMLNASSNLVTIGDTGIPHYTSFIKSNTNRGPMQQMVKALKPLTVW